VDVAITWLEAARAEAGAKASPQVLSELGNAWAMKGDYAKAKAKLGWAPTVTLDELAKMMVDHDMELASREKTLRDAGHKFPARTGQHEHPQLRV